MNEPYLWDKSGPPDPFVAKLEAALGGVRSKVEVIGVRSSQVRRRVVVASAVVAAAAGLILWFGFCSSPDAAEGSGEQTLPSVANEEDRAPGAAIAVSQGIADSSAQASAQGEPVPGSGAAAESSSDSMPARAR